MNKTAIRNFAIWARNKLIADISYHAGLLGISKNGITNALPQSTKDVEFYDIGTTEPYSIRGDEILQRKSLADTIRAKEKDSNFETAYNSVIEEVAYTWFNRLIAVRFMEVNDYLPEHVRVLSSESGKQEPDIVTTPFDAALYYAEGEQQQIIQMKNDNKLDEVFRILFIKQCRELSRILPQLFEGTNDYTELLLSLSFIDQEGVVYHLVHDIPEDDFNVEKGGQVEIIGWLYQYYNSELKDETFALLKNNVKVTKERIPSATQLFTPDWIVRYMVENSLGRLWVEGHPNDVLKSGWKYYVDEAEQEASVKEELEKIRSEYAKLNPEDIKIIDPCMGSGHILVYAFDVLMQIYESTGYSQRDAAKSILENNLFGLDIDDRAAQLAYFAVMMKARQYNRRILDGQTDCNVYAIKESNSFDRKSLIKIGDDLRPVAERLLDAFIDAKEYGSIINVNVTLDELDALDKRLDDVDRMSDYGNLLDMMYAGVLCAELDTFIKQARIMLQKYNVVVTNPPYMGAKSMSSKLAKYVQDHFETVKSDMFSVFILHGLKMCSNNGFSCLVTMQSWMFLSSFEKMRNDLLKEYSLENILHMGNMVMGIAFGTSVSLFRKSFVDRHRASFIFIDYKDIKNDVPVIFPTENERNGTKIINEFSKIPGNPVAYWASDRMINNFVNFPPIGEVFELKQGLITADNERFLRQWSEVDFSKFISNASSIDDFYFRNGKWLPYNKGGEYRKWFGNNNLVVNWKDKGFEIRNFKNEKGKLLSRPQNIQYFGQEGASWSIITNGNFSLRYTPTGFGFDARGSMMFSVNNDIYYALAIMNSNVARYYLSFLSPTVSFEVGNVSKIPYIYDIKRLDIIVSLANYNVNLSKADWDSFETSWDFKRHPLV